MRKIIAATSCPSRLQSITICNVTDKVRSINKNNSGLQTTYIFIAKQVRDSSQLNRKDNKIKQYNAVKKPTSEE